MSNRKLFPDSDFNRRSFIKLGALAIYAFSRTVHAETGPLGHLPERTLSFYNLHTTESLKTVYWANGLYVPEALADINHNLRDYRTNEVHEIDPRLLDVLCELRLKLDTASDLQLISGYRSAATNKMLRGAGNGVAEHSLHVQGMATDIRIPGRDLALVRKAAISMKAGGVGYYPASQFVHVDVGRVRTW